MRVRNMTQGQRMSPAFRWGATTCLIALVVMGTIGLIEAILDQEIGWNSWLPFAAGAVATLPMLGSEIAFRWTLVTRSFKQTTYEDAREMREVATDRWLIALDLAKFALVALIVGSFLALGFRIFGVIPAHALGQPGEVFLAVLTFVFFVSAAVYFAIRWRWPLRHDQFLIERVPKLDLILVDPSRAPRSSVGADVATPGGGISKRRNSVPWRALVVILGGVAALTLVGFVVERAIPQWGGAVAGALSSVVQTVAFLALLAWGVWAILRQRRRP